MKTLDRKSSVLAIEPRSKGLGYVFVDHKCRLIDWGVHEVRIAKRRRCLKHAIRLIRGFQPSFVILENPDAPSAHRSRWVHDLIHNITREAESEGVNTHLLSRRDVLICFCNRSDGSTDGISKAVCSHFPELSARLPKRRRVWETEHYSTALFMAAALSVTFFTKQSDTNNSS